VTVTQELVVYLITQPVPGLDLRYRVSEEPIYFDLELPSVEPSDDTVLVEYSYKLSDGKPLPSFVSID
jgi:hypothetical protein